MNLYGMTYRLILAPRHSRDADHSLSLPCADSAGDTYLPTAAPIHGDGATNGEIGTNGTSIASEYTDSSYPR